MSNLNWNLFSKQPPKELTEEEKRKLAEYEEQDIRIKKILSDYEDNLPKKLIELLKESDYLDSAEYEFAIINISNPQKIVDDITKRIDKSIPKGKKADTRQEASIRSIEISSSLRQLVNISRSKF